jgi:hypothetical protein
MIFVSNILLIILQTYSKKIDTTGIEIIIIKKLSSNQMTILLMLVN